MANVQVHLLDGHQLTVDENDRLADSSVQSLNGVTAGTATASKFVKLDANKAVDVVRTASLRLGASGSEVEVTATATQINAATLAASAVRTVTTTATITAADHNGVVLLNSATGFVTTLPAPIAGFKCEVISKLANTSGNHTVVTASSANVIIGMQNSVAGDAGDTGTADDTISFVANQSLPGDRVELRSDGTSWFAYATSKVAAGMTFTQASA
jgi:hypothetical protein